MFLLVNHLVIHRSMTSTISLVIWTENQQRVEIFALCSVCVWFSRSSRGSFYYSNGGGWGKVRIKSIHDEQLNHKSNHCLVGTVCRVGSQCHSVQGGFYTLYNIQVTVCRLGYKGRSINIYGRIGFPRRIISLHARHNTSHHFISFQESNGCRSHQ